MTDLIIPWLIAFNVSASLLFSTLVLIYFSLKLFFKIKDGITGHYRISKDHPYVQRK